MFRFHEEHVAPILRGERQPAHAGTHPPPNKPAPKGTLSDESKPIEVEASTTTTAQPIRG